MTATATRFAVGLTGGIGSGKSSVAALFERLGVFVIDADAISHALTQKDGPAIDAIARAFAGMVCNGVLDRAALRSRVFSDADDRTKLEAILHPMIRAATATAMSSHEAAAAPYVMHMVPLLFESKNATRHINCAVVVDLPEALQIERLMRTRDLSELMVKQIIASQMSRADRLLRTQFVIDNSGALTALEPQVTNLHRVFLAHAASPFHASLDTNAAESKVA
jgi:dephospho-CoA kinase